MASCSCLRQVVSSSSSRAALLCPPVLARKPSVKLHLKSLHPSSSLTLKTLAPKKPQSSSALSQALVTSPQTEEAQPQDEEENTEIPAENVEVLPAIESEDDSSPPKAKKKTKGLKNIMQTLNKNAVEVLSKDKVIPDIRTGDIVQLRVEVSENRKRASLLRGIVISKHNAGSNSTFRIRRVISGVGVEMVFPLYSPIIKEIKVLDSRKVRRAKLFYLRQKIASLSSC